MTLATVTPDRSLVQRRAALARANGVRSWRKQMKAMIRSGEWTATEVLRAMPSEVESMRVADLLLAVPWFGPVKVGRILRSWGVRPDQTLVALKARHRDCLLLELAGR